MTSHFYTPLSDQPQTFTQYLDDGQDGTVASQTTLVNGEMVKQVVYDYDAPDDWDEYMNNNPTDQVGRIITYARADLDGDGVIEEEEFETHYECRIYDNGFLVESYRASLEPDCEYGFAPHTDYTYDGQGFLYLVGSTVTDPHTLLPVRLDTIYDNYDPFGNPGTVTSENNDVTTYTYDRLGRTLTSILNGKTTTYTYLGDDIASISYPAGDTVSYSYETTLFGQDMHRLASVTRRNDGDPIEGIAYGYTSDSTNHKITTVQEFKDPANTTTRTSTTIEGYGDNPYTTVTDNSRYVSTIDGSESGNHVHSTTWYNQRNLPIFKVDDPDGLEVVTEYQYDSDGRMVKVIADEGETTLNETTTYQYDVWGNLIGATVDPDVLYIATTYTYDGFGRMIKMVSPDKTTNTIYSYNPDGAVATKTEKLISDGSTVAAVAYEYDDLGRLIEVDHGGMEDVYVWDGADSFLFDDITPNVTVHLHGGLKSLGRISAVFTRQQDSSTSFTATGYDYTATGKVAAKYYQVFITVTNNVAIETTHHDYLFSYNDNDVLAKVVYSSGRNVLYCYDEDGDPSRPVEVHTSATTLTDCDSSSDEIATAITYYPFGDIHSLTLHNGQVQHFDRDQRYALTTLTDGYNGATTAYANLAYSYDALGNITAITDSTTYSRGSYGDYQFDYDHLSQLIDADITLGNTAYSQTFTYNLAGNRIQKTQGADVIDYTYVIETNRLNYSSGDRVDNFTYDALGQLVGLDSEYGDTAFSVQALYEDDGQLLGKADSWAFNGQGLTFGDTVMSVSNPAGEAIFKANLNGKFWLYFYDLSGNLIEQGQPSNPTGGGEPLIDHIYLGNRVLASVMGTGNSADYQTCFVATAAFGSPLATELDVFRAFRDRALIRFAPGQAFVNFYYGGAGASAAAWLARHDLARNASRLALYAALYPIKGGLAHPAVVWTALLCLAAALLGLTVKRRGRWLYFTPGLALFILMVYVLSMAANEAWAQTGQSYTEGEIYYYTLDHIGRPFNLRDSTQYRNLRWFENHYPFGETIQDAVPAGMEISAGAGDYITSWTPSFKFPGQYADSDQFPFVQNHFREYMPEYGTYNSIDPLWEDNSKTMQVMSAYSAILSWQELHVYNYANNNPVKFSDPDGKQCKIPGQGSKICTEGNCHYMCYRLAKACFDGAFGYDRAACDLFQRTCHMACIECGEDSQNCKNRQGRTCPSECIRIPAKHFHICPGDDPECYQKIQCSDCKCCPGT